MSACTYTASILHQTVMGNKRVHVVKYTITSYGTEGISLAKAYTGLAAWDAVMGIVLDVADDLSNGPVAPILNATTGMITFIKASDTLVNDATALIAYVTVMGS